MKHRKNNGGMTLTEVIVSMALVCIGILIIALAVAAAQTLIRRGVDTGTATQQAFSEVEQGMETIPGTVSMRIGNTVYTVNGNYLVGGEDNTTTAAFQPDLSMPGEDTEEDPVEELP